MSVHANILIARWAVLLSALCSAAAVGQDCIAWKDVTPQVPDRVERGAMAYDSRRGIVVAYRGSGDGNKTPVSETWEWDGLGWELRSTSGPSPRRVTAMAFDSQQGVTVLHGGVSLAGQLFGDTWEWDGERWTLRAPNPGLQLIEHAMTYDSLRGVRVIVAGRKTWEWDGQKWAYRSAEGPQIRYGHAMTFDSRRGVVVVFGGWSGSGSGHLSGTWEWDGESWELRSETGPAARSWHAMVFDTSRGVTVLYGGGNSVVPGISDETWEWDGAEWTQRMSSGAGNRTYHSMAYDELNERTILFGPAHSDSDDGETWAWDGEEWTYEGGVPATSSRHVLAFDSRRGVTVMHGGTLNPWDTWEWDGRRWIRRRSAEYPGSAGASMVFDCRRNVCVLTRPIGVGANVWEWDGERWELRELEGPGNQGPHALAFDRFRGVTVAYYGYDRSGSQTWEYDGTSWKLCTQGVPSRRSYTAMAYDDIRKATILFGGTDAEGSAGNLGDTWMWDGVAWKQMEYEAPAHSGHGMAFDSGRGVIVMHGGYATDRGTFWLGKLGWESAPNGPDDSLASAIAYDSLRGQVVFFNGRTWEYGPRTEDLDRDGVADACDECLNTIPDVAVDSVGCPPLLAGDGNRDGDIDLRDVAGFQNCFAAAELNASCANYDADEANGITLFDLQPMLNAMNGPDVLAGS